MRKILLINPSYKACYGSTKASLAIPVYPTLGLSTIAATLLQQGHDVIIKDLSYETYHPENIRQLILSIKPDMIGLTGTTPLFNQVRDISLIAKKISEHILIVAGGPHVSALPEESLLESKIDIVIQGEGDYTICDIAGNLSPEKIPGIFFRKADGSIASTGPRKLIENLDDLPFPAWHLYDAAEYKNKVSRLLARKTPIAMVEFSRGCVFKCDFCASKNTMGLGYRKKSPQRAADEVEHLYKLGYREMVLADDIFTSDNQWAYAVCEAIIKKNTGMVWSCTNGIRVESANDQLFNLMKKAGCYRVGFGFESGNNEVLKLFGKGGKATKEQGKEAVRLARRAGMDTQGCFLLGLSPDTEETMNDTIQYARELELDMLKFGITVALPGTPMFQEYRKKNLIKTYDWDAYQVYTDQELFTHAKLSFETIQQYMKKAMQTAVLRNPRFIIRRILRGLKTGEFFWDIFYFFKFLFLTDVNADGGKIRYAYRSEWPTVDLSKRSVIDIEYQKPVYRDWKKDSSSLSGKEPVLKG